MARGGYWFGIGAMLLFWIVSFVITDKKVAPWALAISQGKGKKEGEEGEEKDVVSASKLQALVWTWVTLFAWGSVFGALYLESRASGSGTIPTVPGIPVGLLVLMGLSVTTAAGAKGITVSYKDQGLIDQASGGAVRNAQGDPDLAKAQMLIWTFVAAVYYLLKVIALIDSGVKGADFMLPDVDGSLLVLMGAAQGTYIGDKLVSRDLTKKPKLQEVKPASKPAGTEVTLLGENFGADQGDNFVEIDDVPFRDGLVWSDLQIQKVIIPTTYKAGDKVKIRVYRDGEYSDEGLYFTVTEATVEPDPNA